MLSMIFLSDLERTQIISQHKRERDKRVCDRVEAVLLFDKGWSIASIAEALLLSEDTIRDHIAAYRDSKKLKPKNGGSTQKLSIEHSVMEVDDERACDWLCLDFLRPSRLSLLIRN